MIATERPAAVRDVRSRLEIVVVEQATEAAPAIRRSSELAAAASVEIEVGQPDVSSAIQRL
jgi:hypothetical protein